MARAGLIAGGVGVLIVVGEVVMVASWFLGGTPSAAEADRPDAAGGNEVATIVEGQRS